MMHLDSKNTHLDKPGQLKVSKFFDNKINGIDPILGHLATKTERYIRVWERLIGG